jgi:hypothetical protein
MTTWLFVCPHYISLFCGGEKCVKEKEKMCKLSEILQRYMRLLHTVPVLPLQGYTNRLIYTPIAILLVIAVLLPRISRQLSSHAKTYAYDY